MPEYQTPPISPMAIAFDAEKLTLSPEGPTLTRRLDALPLALLPQAQARRDWLDDIGCQTLADLRALPRAGLQRRSAPDLLQALDAAYGQAPELHRWIEPPPRFERGYGVLYLKHIGQADTGCDFDFLQTETRAAAAGEPEIH
mgnify:CR=1 FL=1